MRLKQLQDEVDEWVNSHGGLRAEGCWVVATAARGGRVGGGGKWGGGGGSREGGRVGTEARGGAGER